MLPEKELPKEFLSQSRKNYYRAEKIIKALQTTPYDNITTIALTQDRICTSYKGHPNWSVHGLSIGNACVITTSHLGTKNKLWKVVVHEFIHTFYDYPHCPKDDPTCIMRDAKGHADMSNKNGLCHYCDSVINKR
ncbi:MAG: hypothetical protein KBT29_03075 [Prevotellaceae bacterium]|nr:hypothetical protein [Candidatus Minthosoma caballi]